MPIKTVDLDVIANQVGNVYEAVVIMSKRARQVSSNTKAELDDKLAYFEGFEHDIDDARQNEEQVRTSLAYEVAPKPSEVAIGEMQNHEVYYRNPNE